MPEDYHFNDMEESINKTYDQNGELSLEQLTITTANVVNKTNLNQIRLEPEQRMRKNNTVNNMLKESMDDVLMKAHYEGLEPTR